MTQEERSIHRRSRLTALAMTAAWLLTAPTLAAAALTLGNATSTQNQSEALSRYTDTEIESLLAQGGVSVHWPADMHEYIAERAVRLPSPDVYSARVHIVQALHKDAARPHAWAHLAYLETRRAGRTTKPAIDALRQSIAACPSCDADLSIWRAEFILADWWRMPADLQDTASRELSYRLGQPEHTERAAIIRSRALALGIDIAR